MQNKQKVLVAGIAILVAGLLSYFFFFRGDAQTKKAAEVKKQIENSAENQTPLNPADLSPIAGLPCANKDIRPIAVMQPADKSARPDAGFSEADMMFEMLAFSTNTTRLMGVYQCAIPNEIGSIRSARHDYIPLAQGVGAIFVHWGYSHFAEVLLKEKKVVDNIDCLTTSYCSRWPRTGTMSLEDTGHITKDKIEEAEKNFGYSTKSTFAGYPHQAEAMMDQRPEGGHLRIAYPNPNDADYDYDKTTNSFLRTWNGVPDIDKNNNKRVAPKNIVVMTADTEMITLENQAFYTANGVQNPWDLIPEADRAGINGIPGAPNFGRYNNVQIGDPWFDIKDSGEAYFYMNGRETKGTWKKDRKKIDSKLTFLDESGVEIKFVPGQIWVTVMAPGQGRKWTPGM